mmetsp:Transcript_25161/g.29124  ORF Transcript_25161/g.29124 Transcript_25161/m.29124 type:complete len:214 (+) Transcript_25161:121-762(+)
MNLIEMIASTSHSTVIGIILWMSIYIMSYNKNHLRDPNHFNSAIVSNIHSITGILIGSISLYFKDDSIFSEQTLLAWSKGYFIADLVDCVVRKDLMFTVHALIGSILIYACSVSPFYGMRAASRGIAVEFSNPFYNRWRDTKTKSDFRNFLISFFLARIVYTPLFLNGLNVNGDLARFKVALIASIAFYILNFLWFLKAISMYINYDETRKKK